MYTFSNNYIFFHWQYMHFLNINTVFTLQTNGWVEQIHNKKKSFLFDKTGKKRLYRQKMHSRIVKNAYRSEKI